jgi:SAM-dependent methyltransferase
VVSAGPQKFDGYTKSYGDLLKKSIAASGEDPTYFARYKRDCLLRVGADLTRPILDYGCGIGSVTEHLVDVWNEVHGYDPSIESVAEAKQRIPSAVFHSELASVPKGHFGTVLFSGVLHHVPREQRQAVLKEARESLTANGLVAIFEHNPINPLTLHAVRTCPFDDDAILLWPGEVKRRLRDAGFQRIRQDYIVFFPRVAAFLRPLEPKLHWLCAGAQTMTLARR